MQKNPLALSLATLLVASGITLQPSYFGLGPAAASGSEEIYLATEVIEGPTGSTIYTPVAFQGKLYFSASTPELGHELYVYDGASTSLVVDFFPGTGSGMYSSDGILGVFNNKLMLKMDDGTTGYELYSFDGSTFALVVDAKPGLDSGYPSNLIEYGGSLYFSATTFVTDRYGFVWDYTNPPQLLSQAHAGYNLQYFDSPAVLGSDLYFVARTIGTTPGIVKFDGSTFTQFGTTPLNPNGLFPFNGGLVYYAKDSDGFEPWFFDGTNQTKIADLNPGSADGYFFHPVVLGGELVFRARTNAAGFEMWTWDGTNSPVMVSDLRQGTSSGHNGLILGNLGGEIIFLGDDGNSGLELWSYDGATQSRLVSNNPSGVVNYGNGSGAGALIAGTLYFVGTTAASGREIFAYGTKPAGFSPSSVPQPVTLTYDSNGGTGSATVVQLPGNLALNSGATFNRTGYDLVGWDSDSSSATATYALSASLNLTQSQTLFAIWRQQVSTPEPEQQPVSVPIPELSNLDSLKVAPGGGNLRVTGTRLANVYQAFIGEVEAEVLTSLPTLLEIRPPVLEPGLYDLTLVTNFGRVTYQGAIQYLSKTGDLVQQEGQVIEDSFELMGFSPGSSELTGRMKYELGKRVKGMRPLKISCVGQTMGPTVLPSDGLLGLNRGAAVCKQLAAWFGQSSFEIEARSHTAVGARFRSTLVVLSWVE